MSEPAILLDGLTKRYGAETVVSDVTLSVAPGEFLTLLGPSGSGKTTTLSMLAGFVLPDAGRVMLAGRDVTAAPPRARGLGMVFQNYAIFPHLDVFENVAFPLRVQRRPQAEVTQRVMEALALVKLTGFERRFGKQLSGGQQQRVALARAVVAQPSVVLMDEPLGALDKNLRFHMQIEIKEIQRRLGMTVVYVTHDQEEALTMSDRIAIMDGGRVIQQGPPRQVYENPESAFVGRFLGEANLIAARRDSSGQVFIRDRPALADHGHLATGGGYLFMRPEKLSLRAGDALEGANQLAGRILHASFLGNIVRYGVDIGEAEPLLCDAANAPGVTGFAAGDHVVAHWQAADCRLLPG
ncbi:ABC transporter ATP-binding protein [Sediminicoccus sp. KRV36]|uniref:ABC transporter ATP-binding protein n=1 Tax=Sediminicoccus sp. KRV36 TaxID=3133721 RepID=UPI00200D4E32|nr:ABC transporter ATP-binding protein [Sediminicoccus rosea]UPY38782.1 ABC transporter ATP-binding protein [Sediminicoccus rosea]